MRIAIISNISDGIGLARDYELLHNFLSPLGHSVTGFQFDKDTAYVKNGYDLALFLEVLPGHYFDLATTRYWIPNLEWVKPGMLDLADQYFVKVLTKTREAQRVLEPLLPGKVHFTGFLVRDQYDPTVPREPKFLHVGGNSWLRGTEAVADAFILWRHKGKPLDAQITIVSSALFNKGLIEPLKYKGVEVPLNVTILEYVNEEELKRLQNSHFFHLMPSGTEGFGHALREGQSVNNLVITTNQPPMNELRVACLIDSYAKRRYNLADIHDVSALEIHKAVQNVTWPIYLKTVRWDSGHLSPREEFLESNTAFEKSFASHLQDFAPVVKVPRRRAKERKTVAFLGNFQAAESTENMIAWAIEQRLGMNVERLQENAVNPVDLEDAVPCADYLLWVRTPGWLDIENEWMLEFLRKLREKKIPSISCHLDKFFGIPEREALIGHHPFWLTDFVFTADGSRQIDFRKRGVNHFWMKPAVSETYCHPGWPREEWMCDVMFCGAREYHAEYPFRKQMVEFLETTYGDRFKHVTGVRGHALNDVYASARVIVGDCFQAGTPKYASDRLMETTGRHGLLLHPEVEGFSDIQCPTYKPQDLSDLQQRIEYLLALPDTARNFIKWDCADRVAKWHTWTRRMEEILRTVNDAIR